MFEAPKRQLKVSREGIVLIKSFEGFRPRAERRDAQGWIIGYGHTLSAREGATVSEADAELLLQYDLLPVTKTLNESVGGAVNQHQFDALASFAFSVGIDRFKASDVLQRLNAGAADEAADAMVGWPEPVLPAPSLRRRAAERALFVADPAAPVALSDLLSAPLPPAAEPPPAPEAPAPESPGSESLIHDAPFSVVDDTATMEDAVDTAPPAETEGAAGSSPTPESIVEVPVFATAPVRASQTDAPPSDHAMLTRSMMQQRYSPYGAPVVGPLPGLAAIMTTRTTTPATDVVDEPSGAIPPTDTVAAETIALPAAAGHDGPAPPVAAAAILSISTQVEPLFLNAAPPAPGDEGLVLTPFADDQVISTPRVVWPHDDGAPTADQAPLFDDEGALLRTASPVVRHETPVDEPTRFQWGETGAYAIMGAFGLVSFGMSMAAFRLASQQDAGANETTMIAWVLAVIGAACVGVSAYNLYRRWGRADD